MLKRTKIEVAPGRLVISRAGRDKSKIFIVLSLVNHEYVMIADGDLRKVDKPKLKKLKHLNICNYCADDIEKKLNSGINLTNAEIRKALKEFSDSMRQE